MKRTCLVRGSDGELDGHLLNTRSHDTLEYVLYFSSGSLKLVSRESCFIHTLIYLIISATEYPVRPVPLESSHESYNNCNALESQHQ